VPCVLCPVSSVIGLGKGLGGGRGKWGFLRALIYSGNLFCVLAFCFRLHIGCYPYFSGWVVGRIGSKANPSAWLRVWQKLTN
jgi:hypothetical protein